MKYFIILITLSITLLASNTVKINNLEWQDNSEAKTTKLNWQDAKVYCSELSLADYDNWRLPNIKELQSIADVSRFNPAIKKGFKHVTTSDLYWSSSVYVSNSKDAWIVGFKNGYTGRYGKANEHYVRCVRGRQ